MYGSGHPAGGSPPAPTPSGSGVIGMYRPPVLAPSLGTPASPAVPVTQYPSPAATPAGVGPRSVTPPYLGNPPR